MSQSRRTVDGEKGGEGGMERRVAIRIRIVTIEKGRGDGKTGDNTDPHGHYWKGRGM